LFARALQGGPDGRLTEGCKNNENYRMGATLSWREPFEGDNRTFGATVSFGGLRNRGTGYMAYSDRVGPGVLIVPDAHGLSRAFRDLADDLNRSGFTVLCPDLHGADEVRARTCLEAAGHHLADNWHPRLGVIGYSIGGELAGWVAREVGASALVLYYGFGSESLTNLQIPVQGHFGAADEEVPASEAAAIIGDLDEGELFLYEGARHGFANPDDAGYEEASALLAMERTQRFLRYHLS
jgi:carboxymethylenebutenolidase